MDITYVFTLSSGGRAYLNLKEGAVSKNEISASLTGLRPLSFKERGLGGELIDRLELINFIIMHNK